MRVNLLTTALQRRFGVQGVDDVVDVDDREALALIGMEIAREAEPEAQNPGAGDAKKKDSGAGKK